MADDVIRVVDWISYSDAEGKEEKFGGMGGWFGFDQPNTWDDYIDQWVDEVKPYAEAIKDSVLEKPYWRLINGAQHQRSDRGVPLFSDGTVATFSYRGWGDLMAAIATVHDGKEHNYMEFYC